MATPLELRQAARSVFEYLSIMAAGLAGARALVGAPAIGWATGTLGLASDIASALFVACLLVGLLVRVGRWLGDRARGLHGREPREPGTGRAPADDVPAPRRRQRRDDDPVLPLGTRRRR